MSVRVELVRAANAAILIAISAAWSISPSCKAKIVARRPDPARLRTRRERGRNPGPGLALVLGAAVQGGGLDDCSARVRACLRR